MKVVIKAYSIFADYLGDELLLELEREVTVGELLSILKERYKMPAGIKPIVVINNSVVNEDYVIREGSVVHIAPPFSGGSSEKIIDVRFLKPDEKVCFDELFSKLMNVSPACGALAVFVGFVKGEVEGKEVFELEYTAIEDAALAAIRRIAKEEADKYNVEAVAIWHRLGRARKGDVTLVIAAVSTTRSNAINAVHEMLERVKKEVPIFKLEKRSDGDFWIIGDGVRIRRMASEQQ